MVKSAPANAGDAGLTLGQEHPLERELATHSSILVWEISWTEEPVGLQSMGHALVTKQQHVLHYVCVYHIFFVHSSVDAHICCFPCLDCSK